MSGKALTWKLAFKRAGYALTFILLATLLLQPSADMHRAVPDASARIAPLSALNPVAEAGVAAMGGLQARVMTFNIRYGEGYDGKSDLNRTIDAIRAGDADIVALQEVDRYNPRSGLEDQINVIADELGMSWAYAPAIRLGILQFGNAVLSRYPIESAETIVLPGNVENRSLLHAVLDVNGRELSVFVTHLGLYEEERQAQLPLLREQLEQVERPAVLMGDMNMKPADPLLAEHLPAGWKKVPLGTGGGTVAGGRELDHIYVNRYLTYSAGATIPTAASDHLPVTADIVASPAHLLVSR